MSSSKHAENVKARNMNKVALLETYIFQETFNKQYKTYPQYHSAYASYQAIYRNWQTSPGYEARAKFQNDLTDSPAAKFQGSRAEFNR
jgi:hypothetical protein